MSLQTKYISLDDFKDYFGIDLVEELGTTENAIGFLKRIEDRMEVYLDSNFNKHIEREYPHFSDNQKEHYKLALLEQAIYIWRNGDVSVDSGYDIESGEKVSRGKIKEISIATNSIDHLRMCGLWNRSIARTFWGPFGI